MIVNKFSRPFHALSMTLANRKTSTVKKKQDFLKYHDGNWDNKLLFQIMYAKQKIAHFVNVEKSKKVVVLWICIKKLRILKIRISV